MALSQIRATSLLDGADPVVSTGLLGMTSPATTVQPVAQTVQPTTTVQPVAQTATPVAQPATPAPIWTGSLADLLNPNSLGMGQQLSPEAWAAIDKATGTNIGPAQDGSPYYSFTGLTDENSTGWTPTQAYYDALNGYTASNLGNDANSNYWNISGPNGTTSSTPTFTSNAQDSMPLLDALILGGIGAAAGPALFAGLGGGATAGLGANLLAGAGSGAVLGGTMGAVTSTGDLNAIGQGILNGGLTGALGGAVYQGLNGTSPTAIDTATNLPNYALDPANSLANQAAIGASGLPNYALDPVNSFANQAAIGATGLPNYALDPVNSSGITNSFGLPNYAVDPVNSYANQAAIDTATNLPNYAVDPINSYASQQAINVDMGLPNYAVDPANSYLNQQAINPQYGLPNYAIDPPINQQAATVPAVPDVPSAPTQPAAQDTQAPYSNEGSHYTDQSTLNPATDSPVNAAPAASPGLLDWLKANPELAKLGLTAAGGLLGGLGSMGGGSIAKKPITPNLWTVGKASNNYTPPTQYAAPQLNLNGQQNSGAWRWMKG